MSLRVFVGTAPNGEDAESCMVLEHSLRKHCSQPVEIVWMALSRNANSFWSGWDSSRWATPFSGFRWGIPAYCEYRGRALYMDSDMIVRADVAELFAAPFERPACCLSRGDWRYCVTLWDCERAKDLVMPLDLLKGAEAHRKMVTLFRVQRQLTAAFDKNWNWCDAEPEGPIERAKIVHYTDMSRQPHLDYAIDRLAVQGQAHWYDGTLNQPYPDVKALFETEYAEALSLGYRPEQYEPLIRFGDFKKASLKNYGRAR